MENESFDTELNEIVELAVLSHAKAQTKALLLIASLLQENNKKLNDIENEIYSLKASVPELYHDSEGRMRVRT